MKDQIRQLLDYSKPCYGTNKMAMQYVSPVNTFPYDKFYRGSSKSYRPIIIDRQAGRVIYRTDNKKIQDMDSDPSNGNMRELIPLCFQTPVTTNLPCTDKMVPLKSNIIISP